MKPLGLKITLLQTANSTPDAIAAVTIRQSNSDRRNAHGMPTFRLTRQICSTMTKGARR